MRKQTVLPRKARGVVLLLEGIEDRLAPATFAESFNQLNLDFNVANKSVAIVSDGTFYSFALTGDTWSGLDSANTTGNSTATLTVTAAGLAAFGTINFTDSAAGSAVNFVDSGTNKYGGTINVVLDDPAAGAISFSGSTAFTGTAALSASTSRNIVVNVGASVTTVDGNLTLLANQQVTPTAGNFVGIEVNGGMIQAIGTGAVTIQGKGGTGFISIIGDTGDGAVDVNGLAQDQLNTQLRTGTAGNNVRGVADVYFFALPTFSTQSALLGTTLNIQYLGISQGSPGVFATPEFNIDLFGLGARSTPTILNTDYFDGNSSLSTDSLIAKNFITPTTPSGSLQASGGSLLNFLTSLYQLDGTPVAPYAVFRTNANVHLPVNSGKLRGYESASADNLDLTTLPRLDLAVGYQFGVRIHSGGEIIGGTSGLLSIQGTGGTGTGGGNYGVIVTDTGSTITSGGGNVLVVGVEGGSASSAAINVASSGMISTVTSGGTLTLSGNSMNFDSTATISSQSNSSVTLQQRTNGVTINLGTAGDPVSGPLNLSDAELDRVISGTLKVGNTNSGAITISADTTRPTSTNIELTTGGDVVVSGGLINANGGTLLLHPGSAPKAVKPTHAGLDASASVVSIASDLNINIAGTTVDSQYDQLSVAGAVNLTGVNLNLSGAYIPTVGDVFTVVSATSVTGTFNGPTTFLFNGKLMEVNYTSNAVQITMAPAAPTGLTATPGNGQVTLGWNPAAGATSYHIFRGTAPGSEGSTVYQTVTGTGFTDSAVTNGTTYYYQVASVNGGGQGLRSGEVSAKPQVPAPAAPTGLSATPGDTQVSLSWSATAGAVSYTIYRGITSGAETLLQPGVIGTTFLNSGLNNGTPYFYQITAVNPGGESPRSTEVSATPLAPPTLIGYHEFGAGNGSAGTVRFFNPDGSERFSSNVFPGFTGGVRVSAADFNGDGVADLVAGTGPGSPTHVRILDGKDQHELFALDPFEAAFTGGVFVATGDLNGDGKPDLAISPDEGGGPRVRLFSGNGFTQIADFFGIDDPNFRGGARTALNDLNGDGKADLLVAAGFGGGPRLALYDGSKLGPNGGPKFTGDFFIFEQTLRNGVFIAAGDINGDGFADVIAGGGPGGGPRVFALSGKDLTATGTQAQVANFFAGDIDSRGGIRVGVKNLDGDGFGDLIVGAGTGAGSQVTAYLGKNIPANGTPTELFHFDAFSGFTGGVFVG